MFSTQLNEKIPKWYFYPFILVILALPAVAVTVDSGATTSYWLLLLPALIFGWGRNIELYKEEKFFLWGFFVFSLIMALSLINSEDISESIGSFERYARCLLFIPLYLFVKKFEIKLSPYIAWALVLGCLVTGLVAIYQFYILDIPKPYGVRNANRFGFAAIVFFLLLVLLVIFNRQSKLLLSLSIVASLIIIYAIILNHTRGAMLCVFPFVLLLMFYYKNPLSKKNTYLFITILIVLLAIFFHPKSIIGQWYYLGISDLNNFFQDPLNNYNNSWGVRLLLMYHGLLVFSQSPIIGTGLGDYHRDIVSLMESGKLLVDDPLMLMGAHNIFIHHLAETGIIGLIAFVTCIFIIPTFIYTKYLARYRNDSKISFLCLSGLTIMICHFVFGMFNTWLTNNSISIYLILNLIFMTSIFLELKEKNNVNRESEG